MLNTSFRPFVRTLVRLYFFAPLIALPARAALSEACLRQLPEAEKARLQQMQPLTRWRWFLERAPIQNGVLDAAKDDGIPVYDVDMFYVTPQQIAELKAKNKIVICYFPAGSMQFSRSAAFNDPTNQTGPIQCGKRRMEPYRTEMVPFLKDLRREDLCGYVRDWPDNCWLDVRSARVRAAAEQLILEAKSRGCDGVEFDNIDGGLDTENWTDARCPGKSPNTPASPKEMEQAQLAFNRSIAEFARSKCLFAGLKNGHLHARKQCPHFDFAVVESIIAESRANPDDETTAQAVRDWSACARDGKPVLSAEYPANFSSYRCPKIPGFSVTYFKDRRFVDGGVSCPAKNLGSEED